MKVVRWWIGFCTIIRMKFSISRKVQGNHHHYLHQNINDATYAYNACSLDPTLFPYKILLPGWKTISVQKFNWFLDINHKFACLLMKFEIFKLLITNYYHLLICMLILLTMQKTISILFFYFLCISLLEYLFLPFFFLLPLLNELWLLRCIKTFTNN